jgi:hypothetical protein
LLFAVEGRVGQRKLWGIVHLADRHPRQMVNAACAQALDDGVYSYRHVKAITEQRVAQALERLNGADHAGGADSADGASDPASPMQAHHLIRSPQEYGELFAMAAACIATASATTDSTHQGHLFA